MRLRRPRVRPRTARPRTGRNAEPAPKRATEMRSIGEARKDCAFLDGNAALEVAARGLQAQEVLILVRRDADGFTKAACKVKLGEPRFAREVVQADALRKAVT